MRTAIAGLLLVFVLLGHLGATAISAQEMIAFEITSLGGSGITGSGTVMPGPGADESTHLVQWQALAPDSVHAISQYHGTSCDSYDAAPEFVFASVTADSQGKAAARIVVKKPFANWPRRPHFLILHADADPASAAVACGTIVAQAPAASPTPVATADPSPSVAPTASVAPVASAAPVPQNLPNTGGAGGPIVLLLGCAVLLAGLGIAGRRRAKGRSV